MIPIHSNSSCSVSDVSAAGFLPGARREILRPKSFFRPVLATDGTFPAAPVEKVGRPSFDSSYRRLGSLILTADCNWQGTSK